MSVSARLSEYDFELPPALIAAEPAPTRDGSRLMVVSKGGAAPLQHRRFPELVELLAPGSVLVLNETRVIPARFLGRRPSGGKVELLLVRPHPDGGWEALVRSGKPVRPPDERLELEDGRARARVLAKLGPGRYRVELSGGAQDDAADALELAERVGRIPLPPYIARQERPADRERYQTVFARVPGAIAAPTAGLHFTPELLARVEARGVTLARVLLHVGPGTFAPIREDDLSAHRMESERYQVPAPARALIEAARAEGRPVVACGTTAVRALESWAHTGQAEGDTELFIRPGHEFRAVDQLITNFHLPRSTLLLLVSALAGREPILAAYREAVARGYRFYSYGDAMLIR